MSGLGVRNMKIHWEWAVLIALLWLSSNHVMKQVRTTTSTQYIYNKDYCDIVRTVNKHETNEEVKELRLKNSNCNNSSQ